MLDWGDIVRAVISNLISAAAIATGFWLGYKRGKGKKK